ncbi:M28 family metallopeptidase [Mucilaginibacter ginkgonis]|uniref:M28 family peptidase n=1 Tax=Mucilaginibacter ginkgonis TaxID=2682091 RepID=A0A6I4I4Z6_9SPHI|nr:M28 family peptidase [Mucilaginibacter ginkgonis]QQL49047.1 M28 family peptidase [Mucilaginibacter ginkgonis]
MKKLALLIPALLAYSAIVAQPKSTTLPPALSSIKEADLKRDIFDIASDGFRGRRAGTIDEFRAAAWVAQKAMEAGLKPAGEDGTYFQFYNIKRTQMAANSMLSVNNQPLTLSKDYWASQPVDARFSGNVKWLNTMADTSADLQGKIVAMPILPPTPLPAKWISLYGYRYAALAIRQQSAILRRHGVSAIIFVADAVIESEGTLAFVSHNFQEGQYVVQGSPVTARVKPLPTLLMRGALAQQLKAGASIEADLRAETYLYPSVNVIAKAAGTDVKLKEEYILFSGHHDHDGIGNPVAQDSIWNGADDNASVTVGMLAIGRAWVAHPGKRSVLFVWHGAEERGLLGSRWYAAHPTVNKQSIVAVLNGDMIGRNSVDSAALLGSIAPHKNSTALVDMAYKANSSLTKFNIDTSWDDAKHPEGWYFRSDHVPYAQAGIPSIFFTSLLHPDYHTPKDEPAGISIPKLTKMTKWMYATGWLVSQTTARPALDGK